MINIVLFCHVLSCPTVVVSCTIPPPYHSLFHPVPYFVPSCHAFPVTFHSILSHITLPYPIPFCPVPYHPIPYFALPYPILPFPIPSRPIPSHHALSHPILFFLSHPIPPHSVPSCYVFCPILPCFSLSCPIPSHLN